MVSYLIYVFFVIPVGPAFLREQQRHAAGTWQAGHWRTTSALQVRTGDKSAFITSNVPVVSMGRDQVISMRETSILRPIVRGPPLTMGRVLDVPAPYKQQVHW